MTITRLAQFSAETRVLTDLAMLGGTNALPTISSSQAKTGTYSYAVVVGTAAFGKAFESAQTAIRMGYWVYLSSSSIDADGPLIYWSGNSHAKGSGQDHLVLMINTGAGTIELKRPNSAVANTYEVLTSFALPSQFSTTGTWFHVGIAHKMHATDGFLYVYINGTPVLQYTGDTRSCLYSGGQVFSTSMLYAIGLGTMDSGVAGYVGAFVDDMFIDSIVDESPAPVPSRRFMISFPTSAGADDDWTAVPAVANYLNVDDNPNDGDTTYNKALSADLRDTFNVTDITLPVDHRIVAVLPSPFVKRLDSEIAHQLSVHAWDGVQYGDSADLNLSMSYDVPVFARLTTQPDGSDWDETDYNAMQFGYRSRGTF